MDSPASLRAPTACKITASYWNMPWRTPSFGETCVVRPTYNPAMKLFLIVAAAALALGQQPTGQGVNFYSLGNEVALGQRFADAFQSQCIAATDPRLDQIGNRLAANAETFQYRFFIFDGGQSSNDTTPSAAFPADWRRLQIDEAIAIAGGTIFVPCALMARSDPELAAILAHAIGHVVLHHATRIMTRGELAQIGLQAARQTAPVGSLQEPTAIRSGLFTRDRAFEREADLYAVQLLRKGGFDPADLVQYLKTLPPVAASLSSVYPPTQDRIEAVRKAIADLR